MLNSARISQQTKLQPIETVAEKHLSLKRKYLELYSTNTAKLSLDILNDYKLHKKAKYVAVTALTPTPFGEGKTVTTIGLSMALNRLNKNAVCTIRQPSMGPLFGIKGSGSGSGYSQIVPMERINLHLTGDSHAVGIATNLLAAFIDNSLVKYNRLRIEPHTITWKRVVDVNDRALRNIVTGLGARIDGTPRQTGFDITAASEVMAILALCTGYKDLRSRLGKIVIGFDYDGNPVTAEKLKCAGSMAAILHDAVRPNLMQTTENTPAIIHAGPFGNIAHGCSSIMADYLSLRLCDYVVTETGFGADCGAEKFVNIKCRYSGLKPDTFVLVTTIRALKMHSGKYNVVPGKRLDNKLVRENIPDIKKGAVNLTKQIQNTTIYGVPVVVAINKHQTDTDKEINTVKKIALKAGAAECCVSTVYKDGSKGGINLAKTVMEACKQKKRFNLLYKDNQTIKEKIETIAKKIYGAGKIEYSPKADKQIELFTNHGYDNLPICNAKTHLSLSQDPRLKGRPEGFKMHIREIKAAIGAGYLYPIMGEMRTMPGLPSAPAGIHIDIDENGTIKGLH